MDERKPFGQREIPDEGRVRKFQTTDLQFLPMRVQEEEEEKHQEEGKGEGQRGEEVPSVEEVREGEAEEGEVREEEAREEEVREREGQERRGRGWAPLDRDQQPEYPSKEVGTSSVDLRNEGQGHVLLQDL